MDYELKDSGEREEFVTGARRDTRVGKGRYDLLQPRALGRVARVAEKGAVKYGDRNWEKGMPEGRLLDSAFRHLFQYQSGMRDEDHLGQAVWNLLSAMEFQEANAVGVNLPPQPDLTEFWNDADVRKN